LIIKTKVEGRTGKIRTAYYKYMGLDGRPIFGSKNQAANFDPDTGAMVLKQLREIDHRCKEAELCSE
jgi:hypothetical protein